MKRFKNILVAADTRFESHPIVEEAGEIARHNGAALKLVDVVPPIPWTARVGLRDHEHIQQLLTTEKADRLAALAEPLRAAGTRVETKVLTGATSLALIQEVLAAGHDLVMRVAKGKHSRRATFFGSTAMRLLRKCPCPVWLVSPETTPEFKHVLACVDMASDDPADLELNKHVVELADSIGHYNDGRYSIAYAWSIWGEELFRSRMEDEEFADLERNARDHAAQSLDAFLQQQGLQPPAEAVQLLKGDASEVIPRFAADNAVDLVVMGTVARSGMSGLVMGNTAELILNRLRCSVLALKPAGFVSPIKP